MVVAEDFADGRCSTASLDEAQNVIIRHAHWLKAVYVPACIDLASRQARKRLSGSQASQHTSWFGYRGCDGRELHLDRRADATGRRLPRSFAKPIRPVVKFNPFWRTETASPRLPVFTRAAISPRCQSSRTHCKTRAATTKTCSTIAAMKWSPDGCWVVDHVLDFRRVGRTGRTTRSVGGSPIVRFRDGGPLPAPGFDPPYKSRRWWASMNLHQSFCLSNWIARDPIRAKNRAFCEAVSSLVHRASASTHRIFRLP